MIRYHKSTKRINKTVERREIKRLRVSKIILDLVLTPTLDNKVLFMDYVQIIHKLTIVAHEFLINKQLPYGMHFGLSAKCPFVHLEPIG